AAFSQAYSRRVWGDHMAPFEALRDCLSSGAVNYEHLDAGQLVKHAFGLRTQARGRKPALVYLYAEPTAWPDGRAISATAHARHLSEIEDFAVRVHGAEVSFSLVSYRKLFNAFAASPSVFVREHVAALRDRFDV
ncbi:MAG: hypothetical protein ABUS57_19040, partial [Pseudomonadota bacterium]